MPNFYAYLYFDPRTDEPFYVGKGQAYRARKHLHQATNKGVAARLVDLRAVGLAPRIETYECESEAHAFELERQLIAAYGRQCDGGPLANVLEGGERSAGFEGRKHSEESKAKIRSALKARRLTAEHKARIGAANKGRPGPSPEKQALMAAARRRPEVRAKLAASAKRNLTPERQAAMVAAARRVNKGRKASKETREKMSASMKGRVITQETRAKMSAAQRKRYAKPDS